MRGDALADAAERERWRLATAEELPELGRQQDWREAREAGDELPREWAAAGPRELPADLVRRRAELIREWRARGVESLPAAGRRLWAAVPPRWRAELPEVCECAALVPEASMEAWWQLMVLLRPPPADDDDAREEAAAAGARAPKRWGPRRGRR